MNRIPLRTRLGHAALVMLWVARPAIVLVLIPLVAALLLRATG